MAKIDRDFLIEGVCKAIAHAAQLAADATTLLGAYRISSAFVLSVMAREELGRANILWKRANDTNPGEALSAAQAKLLMSNLNSHLEKLNHGQSTTHCAMPADWLARHRIALEGNDLATLTELHAERRRIAEGVRKLDPKRTHNRRLDAQYVSLRDGSWSDPSEVTLTETRNLLVDVAHEIGGTLMEVETNAIMTAACVRYRIALPRSGDFDSTVSHVVFLMKPEEELRLA